MEQNEFTTGGGQKPNRIVAVQECDATMFNSSNAARLIILNLFPYTSPSHNLEFSSVVTTMRCSICCALNFFVSAAMMISALAIVSVVVPDLLMMLRRVWFGSVISSSRKF